MGARLTRLLFVVLLTAAPGECCFAISQNETALLQRIDSQNTPQLRADALELLQATPKSAVAHLVLSRVEEERANMPGALREAHAAWGIAQAMAVPPPDGQPSVPTLCLYRLAELYGNLDRRSEQLAWHEEYERLGCPQWEDRSRIRYPAARLKVVALLKLGRVSEASQYIDAVELAPERFKVSPDQVFMDRIRVAGARDKGSENAWKLCLEFEEKLRGRKKRLDAGFLVNLGNYALRRLELDKAAAYFQESTATINPETRFNPFQRIAEIQMARGQWKEAQNSIGSAWAWIRTKQSPVRLEMTRSLKLTVARYYLLYGSPDKALQHLANTYAEPQRMRDSLESGTRWKAEAAYTRAESLEAVWDLFGGLGASPGSPAAWITNRAAVWTEKQKFAGLVAAAFAEPAPPLHALGVTTSGWPAWWLNMPEIYGRASARHLLERLGIDSGVEAYRAAFNAVVEGEPTAASKLAAAAVVSVPAWDVITRARMELVLAQSKAPWAEASVHYVNAYRLHAPSLIGCGLPVRINSPAEMEGVSRILQQSNCLKATGAQTSFLLELGAAKVVLSTGDGVVLRECAYEAAEQPQATAARLLRAVFAAGPVLGEREIASLDGNTAGAAKAQAQAGP